MSVNTDAWRELLELWEENSALWEVKSPEYLATIINVNTLFFAPIFKFSYIKNSLELKRGKSKKITTCEN